KMVSISPPPKVGPNDWAPINWPLTVMAEVQMGVESTSARATSLALESMVYTPPAQVCLCRTIFDTNRFGRTVICLVSEVWAGASKLPPCVASLPTGSSRGSHVTGSNARTITAPHVHEHSQANSSPQSHANRESWRLKG